MKSTLKKKYKKFIATISQKPAPVFLIPNATSAANVGDEAMLHVLMSLIKAAEPEAVIKIHGFEPETHEYLEVTANRPTLYYWAVFSNPKLLIRAYRMLIVVAVFIGLTLRWQSLLSAITKRESVVGDILNDFLSANVIVTVGGGYLRSKPGISQALNFLMILSPFALANFSSARKIISPISVGPFAQSWQGKVAAKVVRSFDVVAVRERFSFALVKSLGVIQVQLASDHALLLPQKTIKKRSASKKIRIGFTVRPWLAESEQLSLESAYATTLASMYKKYGATIVPIVQVNAAHFGEDDALATKRVMVRLARLGVPVAPAIYIENVDHGLNTYGALDLLIGMRMHSNIFAGTQGTPFVPISYEYKTEGISEDFGLHDFCIKCSDVTEENLLATVQKLINRRSNVEKQMMLRLQKIQKSEAERWVQELKIRN